MTLVCSCNIEILTRIPHNRRGLAWSFTKGGILCNACHGWFWLPHLYLRSRIRFSIGTKVQRIRPLSGGTEWKSKGKTSFPFLYSTSRKKTWVLTCLTISSEKGDPLLCVDWAKHIPWLAGTVSFGVAIHCWESCKVVVNMLRTPGNHNGSFWRKFYGLTCKKLKKR